MCAIDGAERYDVYETSNRRARKPHKCGECGRPIIVGELYRSSRGLFEGSWNTNCICAHCQIAADWLTENCAGFVDNGVYEDIHEHAEEYFAIALPIYRLCVGMRRKWVRFDGAGLMPPPRLPPSIKSIIVPPASE